MKWRECVCVAVGAVALMSQSTGPLTLGKQTDGSLLLPTGWRVQPAGTQIPLDTLPMSMAVSPDGKFVLVLNGGYKPPSISVIQADSMKEIARVPVADAWLGLAFAPNGRTVYAGGGSRNSVLQFTFSEEGELRASKEFPVSAESERNIRDFIGDVTLSPDGRLLYAAELYRDSIAVINPLSGLVVGHYKTGRRPYRILFAPDGRSFFVSSWADGTVYLHDAINGAELDRVRLGPHTTDMVLSSRKPADDETATWRYRLFVTAAHTNNVFAVGVSQARNLRMIESINVAPTSRNPLGMTPSGLGLSVDETRLYVACSDANVIAVADISEARSRVAGFVPTGWYPTTARSLADGRLLALNGRGGGSAPSRYSGPGAPANSESSSEYPTALQTGTLSVVPPLTDESLAEHTRIARNLSPYRDALLDSATLPSESVIDSRAGRPSPIQHVVYIVKEGRTYDQVFGKLGKGDGNASLTLFDEAAAPNHYKLAREFVLFDNFYVNGEASAEGHNWAMAAIASDYVQKLWPNSHSGRRRVSDYEGGEPANIAPAGYLWSNALSAGLSVRNYGEWVQNKEKAGDDGVQVQRVLDPSLQPVTNLRYRGFDLDYPDVERARVFLADLQQFESSNTMPRLMILRLGNDQTSGPAAGRIAPRSAFADNDQALGMIVEGLSKSRFWGSTAIFVIEASASLGPDHVDSHRSILLAVSPYTRRGVVDSSFYNQSSVLRSMETILGMRPLTHFDAAARTLTAAFAASPNSAPYTAEKPRISLTERNPGGPAAAAGSVPTNFNQTHHAGDAHSNDALRAAIGKTNSQLPARSDSPRP